MAGISNTTFSDLSGAATDLFAGFGAQTQANLKAQGLQITAEGTLIGAQGTQLTAQGTIITAEGTELGAQELRIKAQGDTAEATGYDLASALARQNEAYVVQSTAIQESQLSRQITATIGTQKAGVAGAGLASSGSAVYLLADSASQGALAKNVLAQQGQITEAGYEEQAQSYDTMSAAAKMAASGETSIAGSMNAIATQQQGIAAGQMNIATAETGIAGQQMQLAAATQAAGSTAATGDFVGAALKGVAAIATLAA